LCRQPPRVIGKPDPHRGPPCGDPKGETRCRRAARHRDGFATGNAHFDGVVSGLEIAGQAVGPPHLQRRGPQVIQKRELIERIALRRLGTPDDIAAGVLFFASDFAGWITGQVLAIDGGK